MNLDTYLVTDDGLSGNRSTLEVVEAAIASGIDVVQLREKATSARSRYELGLELRETTREASVTFIVNDRVDIAAAVDADGVHLGDEDLPVAAAREQLGPDAIIGRSVSTIQAARAAERAGADYLGVGAVFATDSKDTEAAQSELGVERVRRIDEAVDVPFVAIGGVTPANASDVVAAGADGVAVISTIAAADDPETATRELNEAVAAGKESRTGDRTDGHNG